VQNDSDVVNAGRLRRAEPTGGSAFTAYGPQIVRYLSRRIPNPEDVRELAQEIFLRATRRFCRQDIAKPMAYLYTIARNVVCEFHTRQKQEREVLIFNTEEAYRAADDLCTDSQSTSCEVDDHQDLVYAIARLPEQLRQVMTMYARDGMSEVQIAAALGLPVDTILRYTRRALARIQKTLRRAYP
jgi:RNA polymerase sigma-70 factor (ECF subfamily)